MASYVAESDAELEFTTVIGVGRCSSGRDGRDRGSDAEVIDDARDDVGVGDEREDAERVTTARTLSNVWSENAAE